MIVLGIDTASAQCAVALVRGDACLAELDRSGRHGQSERLLPMVESCLAAAGVGFADLAGVAAATGPGSFTGLRVGLAAAQGLALACGIQALGIDSFTACRLSQSTLQAGMQLTILESFRTELYWQLCDSQGQPVLAPACSAIPGIIAALPPGPVTVLGDGAAHLAAALAARPDCTIIPSTGPSAAAIAREGCRLLRLGQHPPATATYVRPADAKPAASR